MASKGQKFRIYSNLEREEIITKYLSGNYSYRMLANEYGGNPKSIQSMILKFKKNGNYQKMKPPGRNGGKGIIKEDKLTKEDYKERYEILKKYQAFLKAQRERK